MPDTLLLSPAVAPLAFLLGTWRGEGRGEYPSIDSFRYDEEVEFWHIGKPFIGYHQRTSQPGTGAPMHTESGFWRVATPVDHLGALGPGDAVAIEATITQPTGLSEVLVGTLVNGRLDVRAIEVVRTPTAKEVTEVERIIEVDGDVMRYEVRMAAVGLPLQGHLEAELRRVVG